MSLEDTVNDARKCGAPDLLSYLLSILFFAQSPSEQTLMNVNAVESYLQEEEDLLVAVASPSGKESRTSGHASCHVFHCTILSFPSNKGKILTLLCLNPYYALMYVCISEPHQELNRAFQHFKGIFIYKTHFLDSDTSTLSVAFFESHSPELPSFYCLAPAESTNVCACHCFPTPQPPLPLGRMESCGFHGIYQHFSENSLLNSDVGAYVTVINYCIKSSHKTNEDLDTELENEKVILPGL